MTDKIPVSVLITTKNEEGNIARCIAAVQDFAEVIVIDSNSSDRTCEIAKSCGTKVEMFEWNGQYPKKRQWCLDHLGIKHDWVFWVDADEVITPDLISEIRELFKLPRFEAGFFVKGNYIFRGQTLYFGMKNNKIALMNRYKMVFPVVNDLDIEGMGEIEGHYQPIRKTGYENAGIGQVSEPLLHFAYADEKSWSARHERYARWEAEMTKRGAWPQDPVKWRDLAKKALRRSPLRPQAMFFYSYVMKLGVFDGKDGYDFAKSRKNYSSQILRNINS